MATLKRVGPGSAFKVGLVVYAFLGLLVGICVALFSMVAGSLTGMAGADAPTAKMMGLGMGFGPLLFSRSCTASSAVSAEPSER